MQKFTAKVWNAETRPFFYRTSLTKANQLKDQRVRFGWNETLASSLEYWKQREAAFDALLATELLSTASDEEVANLRSILKAEARLLLLEPSADVAALTKVCGRSAK